MLALPSRKRRARLRPSLPQVVFGAVIATALTAAAAEDFIHVTRPGDNPWNLARRYLKGMDYWPRLQEYNGIADAGAIQPGTPLRFPVDWMRGRPGTVLIEGVRGQAEMQRGKDVAKVEAGMRGAAGATLRTGADGSLTLRYPDGSRTLLGPDSTLRLDQVQRLEASKGQQVRFKLLQGGVENEVRGKPGSGGRFIIQTPAATAAVRGTSFRVATAAAGARSETLRGVVALHNGKGSVLLRAGTGSQAQAGRAPAVPVRLLPAPELAGIPERVERVPVSLEIPAVPGAVRYRTRFAADESFSALESDQISSSPRLTGGADLADGIHRVRVRAIDAQGFEGLDAEREIVVDARPEPPFPAQPPADGWVTDERPAFRWARSSAPGRYRFQLSADDAFRSPLVDRGDLDQPEFVLAEPLPPGQYFWRVALHTEAEGRGPFSDPQRFRLPPPGPSPEPPSVDSGKLELRWRAAGANDRYQVQVSRDPDFAKPEVELESGEPSLSIPKPDPGVHHVRVRTVAPGSPPGPWGGTQQVEIAHEYWRALLILVPALLLGL